MKLFVVDPHTIYRRGLVVSLGSLEEVESVADAESVRDAWEHASLSDADLVVLDQSMCGAAEFIAAVAASTGARTIVCTSDCSDDAVLAAIRAGAVGFLRKDTLTPGGLAAAVRAAANGSGVIPPELLGNLLRGVSGEGLEQGRTAAAVLNDRERRVLALIADGHPTREVAKELSFSERTIKNVMHDVLTKLNARSRSQAVAFAVREGLI